jgi:dGTPase
MRAGLIYSEQLKNVEIFAEAQGRINTERIKDQTILRTRVAKTIIDRLVSDCIDTSKETICRANVKTLDDVYSSGEELIILSPKSNNQLFELEKFLLQNFYRHKSLLQTTEKVKNWLHRLFEKLCHNPDLMPQYFQGLINTEGLQRTVCDYISGMTDRFCIKSADSI